ncbi:hypothetical protein V6N12_065919 [Hibiscus sabdariffa]|uniref:Uncharacterized protein n=1 Tax=Hibiscus sabdariffa TaxID=183260 RepID=A0ABR2BEZ9_9ROSI
MLVNQDVVRTSSFRSPPVHVNDATPVNVSNSAHVHGPDAATGNVLDADPMSVIEEPVDETVANNIVDGDQNIMAQQSHSTCRSGGLPTTINESSHRDSHHASTSQAVDASDHMAEAPGSNQKGTSARAQGKACC